MCQMFDAPPTGVNEYFSNDLRLQSFIEAVETLRAKGMPGHEIVAAIEPLLADLMIVDGWLPPEFQQPQENSGMGGGIGMWLLYRAGDGGLAFSSLVVPPGAETPVHDHLAWGIVGLYRGTQDEIVYKRDDSGHVEDFAELSILERRSLTPGALYELLPETDIHRVRTTSDVTSVSLHLLGNDNGCIWRHRFEPEQQTVKPFKSGWLNVPCVTESAAAD